MAACVLACARAPMYACICRVAMRIVIGSVQMDRYAQGQVTWCERVLCACMCAPSRKSVRACSMPKQYGCAAPERGRALWQSRTC
eukprot:6182106-Pleurochrysis_carterae.AAC.3